MTPTPADTLRHAALYLQRYGWIQGAFYGPCRVEVFPPADVAGSIRAAVCGTPVDDLSTRTAEEIDLVRAAQLALITHLAYLYGGHDYPADYLVAFWNDMPYQDAAGIISELHSAATGKRDTTTTRVPATWVFVLAGAR